MPPADGILGFPAPICALGSRKLPASMAAPLAVKESWAEPAPRGVMQGKAQAARGRRSQAVLRGHSRCSGPGTAAEPTSWPRPSSIFSAGAQASPGLQPCLTLVPSKPCDEPRPQERGFNKRYRFLELRLGDFPEDRLCLAGGCVPRGVGCPFLLCSCSCRRAVSLWLPGNTPPSNHSVTNHPLPTAPTTLQQPPPWGAQAGVDQPDTPFHSIPE